MEIGQAVGTGNVPRWHYWRPSEESDTSSTLRSYFTSTHKYIFKILFDMHT